MWPNIEIELHMKPTCLSRRIKTQILKAAYLMKNGDVIAVVWEFFMDNVYADTDAYNVYKLLKNCKTMEEALDNYYKGGYLKRYTEFTNNWSEAKVKDTTYIYTKNKYMGLIRWPLFDYDFKTNQSKAARDAFAEFVLERRKSE